MTLRWPNHFGPLTVPYKLCAHRYMRDYLSLVRIHVLNNEFNGPFCAI